MTLPASPSHETYIGDGVTTQFTYPFKVTYSNEIEVRVNSTVVTETVSYSVSGIGNDGGGTVTFFIAPTFGTIVSIRRFLLFEQLLDLIPNGALPAEAIEFRFDQIVKMIQQLEEELTRRVGFPVGARLGLRDLLVPEPGNGKLIGWDATGEHLTLYSSTLNQVIPDEQSGIVYGEEVVEVPAVPGNWVLTAYAAAPIGVELLGVTYYCDTTFDNANGLTSFDIGGFGIQDGWGHNIGIIEGTVTGPGDFRRGDHPIMTLNGDILLTANGGPCAAVGTAILTVHWRTLIPRTSV